jgi:PAS domain S-box-containing protein
MEINYIAIYDLTPRANFLFVSESVQDVLGFTPEELVGRGGFEITHPDEREALNVVHTSNVKDEHMSSIVYYQCLHKDGHYVHCDSIVHYCYDVIICTNFAVVSPDSIKHKMRINSADEAFTVDKNGVLRLSGAWNNSQEKMKNLMASEYPWDISNKLTATQREPRFCLFINRYTSESIIVFATKMCEDLVEVDQFECIGQSLFSYVAPKDKLAVMKQLELSKSCDLISRLRFKWLKPGDRHVQVEAVVSCTYDGIVMVVRLANLKDIANTADISESTDIPNSIDNNTTV